MGKLTIEPPAVRATTLGDLTIGQIVALLSIHGGPHALQFINAIVEGAVPRPSGRARPEDLCALAILNLAYTDRGGTRLTGKGFAWSRQLLGGA